MSWDLAIDYSTGDLKIASNKDFEARIGEGTIKQRIMVRLKIDQGEWHLDPSGGRLGSRMREISRLPVWRAKDEVELVIREALAPMDDISIQAVTVIVPEDNNKTVEARIEYLPIFSEEEGLPEDIETVMLTIPFV